MTIYNFFSKYITQSICLFVCKFVYSITPKLLQGWQLNFLEASEEVIQIWA